MLKYNAIIKQCFVSCLLLNISAIRGVIFQLKHLTELTITIYSPVYMSKFLNVLMMFLLLGTQTHVLWLNGIALHLITF